jgi:hypothetical protein
MTDEDLRRAYMAMKVTTFHRKMKLKAIEYKGGKCQVCGYAKSAASLTFHHRDPSQKDFAISGRVVGWSKMQPELDKCDLLCANCHSEEHERLSEIGRQDLYVKIRTVVPERLPAEVVHKNCYSCGTPTSRLKSGVKSERLFCSTKCSSQTQERVGWPTDLEQLVKTYPLTTIGRHLGVSGNAVKKRCRKLGIPVPGRGHWQKVQYGKV